jgi:predicted nucleotidyltransferase
MEKTLKVIRELKKNGAIKDYAIGGAIAALYYVEPLLTYDLDIFFIPVEESLDVLSPIYNHLKKIGYKTHKEHMIIEGVPVQFIPVYNELIKEAVENSVETKYGRIKTKVIGVEYLIAIMIQTFRPKDRERIVKIVEETEIDLKVLEKILKKYSLDEKFIKFRGMYYGKSS